jgi:uncharacterized cupin superfamily protein
MLPPVGVPEARIEQSDEGAVVASEGWFVLNAADASWTGHERSGRWVNFEGREHPFREFGIGIHVLQPGEPNGKYHAEEVQEDFLVLSGECICLIEGEERRLKAWDFVHCPPGTLHIFVGAGDGPCAILMAGARLEDEQLHYPVSELAAGYGASVEEETSDFEQVYARFEPSRRERPSYWDELPWA